MKNEQKQQAEKEIQSINKANFQYFIWHNKTKNKTEKFRMLNFTLVTLDVMSLSPYLLVPMRARIR